MLHAASGRVRHFAKWRGWFYAMPRIEKKVVMIVNADPKSPLFREIRCPVFR